MAINPTIGAYAHNYMMFTFGDWTTDFARLMAEKDTGLLRHLEGNNLWEKTQDVWSKSKQAYKGSQLLSRTNNHIKSTDSFGKYATGMVKSWGEEITIAKDAAKSAGTSKLLGGAKGLFKGFSKRMPLIGTVVQLAMEAPNLWNAFTSPKGGVGTGLLETGKTGLKLGAYAGGAALGATIGTMIFPGVGTGVGALIGLVSSAVGGWAAGWVADKIMGKSFSEQQEEEKAKQAQGTPQQDLNPAAPQQTAVPQSAVPSVNNNALAYNNSANPFASQNYMDRDIMSMSAGLG